MANQSDRDTIAIRTLSFRRKGVSSSLPFKKIVVRIFSIEPSVSVDPNLKYHCVIGIDENYTEIFGFDQVSTMISAISSVSSFCEGLNELGELWTESGPYDSELHGIKGLCKRFQLYQYFNFDKFKELDLLHDPAPPKNEP